MTQYAFVTLEACRFFQIYGPPPAEWFDSLLPTLLPLPSFRMGDGSLIVWVPDEAATVNDSLCAAFSLTASGMFEGLSSARKVEAFNRVLRLIQANMDQSISIPSLWRSFNSDSLISIQSSPRAKGESARVLFDRKKFARVIGVSYGVIDDDVDLMDRLPKVPPESSIVSCLASILRDLPKNIPRAFDDGAFDLEATNRSLGLGPSLDVWYESKLTETQRKFVDFPLSRSIRVRGPGGSGKTVAMVVKALRQLELDRAAKRSTRYGFLTHSQATVEVVQSMVRTMIGDEKASEIAGEGSLLYIGTLYSLAYDTLGTELRGVLPLSLDGRQGREMQYELLNSVVKDYIATDWIARKGGCSTTFVELMEAAAWQREGGAQFLYEILNEFACVLEPEGVARSAQKKNEYISKAVREAWRLQLGATDERRVMIDLHAKFRKEMREAEAISMDQLVSDFDRFLDSNAWELTRGVSGFDVIFVDELHLLNRMERMLITSLQSDPSSRPIVVMAEDTKQDVRRVGQGLRSWQRDLDGMENFDLNEVFRYTPQINSLLRAVDEFAPTLNLQEDWPSYSQESKLPSGLVPDVRLFNDLRSQYDAIFPEASLSAKKRKSGRSVAVLSCDYDNFKKYLLAGQYRDLFIPVESREDVTLIPSRGVRFVLSMPEFVAGLQFDEVYLIDVSDAVLFSGEAVGVRDKRRGLSLFYLGASRAMSVLHLSALSDAGGVPGFVDYAVRAGICINR